MEIICATAASAALFVPGEPDMRSAAALVRRALAERGIPLYDPAAPGEIIEE